MYQRDSRGGFKLIVNVDAWLDIHRKGNVTPIRFLVVSRQYPVRLALLKAPDLPQQNLLLLPWRIPVSRHTLWTEALMLRWHQFLLALAALLGLLSAPVVAQISPKAEAARLKGIEFLQGEQYEDGSWSLEGHEVGITALCALALIENGVPATSETIEHAQRFIRKEIDEVKETSDIAMAILFLTRVGGRDSRPEIRELAARLIAGQNVEGGWGVTCPLVSSGILANPEERPKPQPGVGDNISTQLAVQALWTASHWGVDIRETMTQVSERFYETQREDGGWPILCEEWTKLLSPEEKAKREGKLAATDKRGKGTESNSAARKKSDTATAKKKSQSKPSKKGDDNEESNDRPLLRKGLLTGDRESENSPAPVVDSAPREYQPSDPAMTFAGLYALAVLKASEVEHEHNKKNQSPKSSPESASKNAEQELLADPSFADALKLAHVYASKIKASSPSHLLWSMERLAVGLGMEKFGETDWFTQGANALVKSQDKNGSWASGARSTSKKSSRESDEEDITVNTTGPTEVTYGLTGELADTSFAILFLRQAHVGSDISRLLKGEPSEPFQIVTQPEKPRFKLLEEALKAAKEGDRICIEGEGPYQSPHIDIDRDLTLEAGFGYQPILQYDVGFDPDGRRSRPQDNPETRHMLRVTRGTLTLEGLDIQMDAPDLGVKVPWAAIVAKGGSLRLLNCSVSEGNKRGMAPIQIAGPGAVILQNTQLIGGRAAVEVMVSGKQQITLNNCVVFSNVGFQFQDGEQAEGSQCQLSLNRCAIQTQDVFHCQVLKYALDIESHGVAYQSEWLGQSMLRSPTGHEGLSWKGSENLYDIKRWIGHDSKPNTTVKDAKSFSTFWGGSDSNGTAKAIPFAVRRTIGGFNHVIKGEDYEFASSSSIHLLRRKTGIDPLNVGPGPSFQRYRGSFEYRSWSPRSETAAAPESAETPDTAPAPASEK